jgi:aspartate/methionine/tyrosine aminotransferase
MATKRPEGSLISYFSNRVKQEGGINLAQGTPGFPPPQELLQLLESMARDERLHQYAPGNGNFELLELIRRKYSENAPVTADNLLIVQGATEGIFLGFFYLTTILDRPFSALSFDPVYESYPILADMFDIPFVYADLEEDLSVDFQRLEQVIAKNRVKVVFIASPGNPLGKVWSKEEIKQMISLSQEHGFYILFDAVYKDIYFQRRPYNPLADNYEKLFYIDSFSKTLSITGWRVGYIIAPAAHMRRIRDMHDYTGLCAPSILQAAIARYLTGNDFGSRYIETVKRKCRESYEIMNEALMQLGFDPAAIDGGYFMWAQLPPIMSDAFRFAGELFESTGIGVVPGENFSPNKTRHVRLNIAVEKAVIGEAVIRIKRFFSEF